MSVFRPDQTRPIKTLELKDITVTNDEGSFLLENINLTLPLGSVVWMKGDFTKSYLLKLLAGLLAPQKGEYLLDGQSVYEMSFEEFLPYRLNIGYSFPFGGILSNRTLRDNISLPFQYHGVPPAILNEVTDQYVKTFGLERFQKYRPFAVPGSYRKLTCVVRAIASHPQVLFMDDPTSALSHENIQALRNWIRNRKEKEESFTIFVGSDDGELFRGLDHEVMIFNEGRYLPAPEARAVGE